MAAALGLLRSVYCARSIALGLLRSTLYAAGSEAVRDRPDAALLSLVHSGPYAISI